MHKTIYFQDFYLGKGFQMLWDYAIYKDRFFTLKIHGQTLLYWLGKKIGYIEHNIFLQNQNSQV